MSALDTRSYLDRTVVPVLLQGLNVIAKERRTSKPYRSPCSLSDEA
ncbi:unnamed protein product [Protopolystoma xenopodis]|uniref:Uncharacterized protein n=1 Tax=Protopolystoma xenopodis TaxID=117903 RepID=A0A3S5FC23_9PLAT|nr:unnamed protein product [Protopolystoma xenopodis]